MAGRQEAARARPDMWTDEYTRRELAVMTGATALPPHQLFYSEEYEAYVMTVTSVGGMLGGLPRAGEHDGGLLLAIVFPGIRLNDCNLLKEAVDGGTGYQGFDQFIVLPQGMLDAMLGTREAVLEALHVVHGARSPLDPWAWASRSRGRQAPEGELAALAAQERARQIEGLRLAVCSRVQQTDDSLRRLIDRLREL